MRSVARTLYVFAKKKIWSTFVLFYIILLAKYSTNNNILLFIMTNKFHEIIMPYKPSWTVVGEFFFDYW